MASRDLEQARKAFQNKDVELAKMAHNGVPADDEEEWWKVQDHQEKHQGEGNYIKSAVYGGLDGMITTFSVVMAVEGASLAAGVVLAMGIANLIGDGLSMALGDYLSTKSEQEFQKLERQREEWEVENNPNGEKKEMFELYREKGMAAEDAKQMVEILSKNHKVWVDIMMVEELGLIADEDDPTKNAIVTFFAFCFFGIIPLSPYVVSSIFDLDDQLFLASVILTGLALWMLGIIKSKFTSRHWFQSGLETFVVGVIAAGASFLIGMAFEDHAHNDNSCSN